MPFFPTPFAYYKRLSLFHQIVTGEADPPPGKTGHGPVMI